MKISIPRLVIAAPTSGAGKSTVTTGLMAALAEAHSVQGFKVGPDYIDPGYHIAATERISRNLDTWMMTLPQVQTTFARTIVGADIAIIEGVMGLFDGYEARTEIGSTAQVAKLLGAPVILVLDVSKMARSAGAMALGYRDFDPALNLAGVICNNVASEKHALWVTEAIEGIGLPVLGCLQRSDDLRIPERHLGLHTAVERTEQVAVFLDHAAAMVRRSIDLDQLWDIANSATALEVAVPVVPDTPPQVRIAVARDEAFCFYYEDNLDLLRQGGADIVFFSPLRDESLPEGIGGIYLGGGYPELYSEQLTANESLCRALREAVADGLPTFAECGGLMVLTESITVLDGTTYPMLGVIPGHSRMRDRLRMGYRCVTARTDTLLLKQGDTTRGHEFHYSDWVDYPADLPHAYTIAPRTGEDPRPDGYAKGHVLASYVHLHFGANAALAPNFVQACVCWQQERQGMQS